MDYELQLKLQAYLDEELPESERGGIADLIERDPQAQALLSELQNTNRALTEFNSALRLPESREFFWSKIARQIEPRQSAEEIEPAVSFWARVQRFLVPASAVGLLTLVLTMSVGHSSASQPGEMELVSNDMGALTFRSQSERMTLVWLYPRGDSDVASKALPIDFDPE